MDDNEFDRFYAASAARLVGQVYVMTGDLTEAQDCVQEAFVRAWRHRRRLDADRGPEAWVRTTASRLAVSRWRRATSMTRAHHRHGPPPDVGGPDPSHAALHQALRGLSPELRRAVVLHYLCDLSVADVAVETASPVGTVKARLHRGRAALALALSDLRDEEVHHA